MIDSNIGQPFDAVYEFGDPGLVGTIAVRVVSTPGGEVILGRSTASIVETLPGLYTATRTIPEDTEDPSLLVVWDLGDPDDPAQRRTEELRLGFVSAPAVVHVGGGITLDPSAVRLSTAALMAYRLRVGGFSTGQGGAQTTDFTSQTVPTLARATEVTTRNAALVSNDFPAADVGDEPELRTIAALRSAIELEASAPNMDRDRIAVWREQLRESVERVGGTSTPGDGEPGAATLTAAWNFGGECDWPAGAERPCDPCAPVFQPGSRRLRW